MHLMGGGGESQPRKSGFLVQELIPHHTQYYNLYTGGLCANHLDKVGYGIDLCIIDTVHAAPGEALDFLMVLPYLAPNAVIILHDIAYHCLSYKYHNVCALLFQALVGEKNIPAQYSPYENLFQNIGSCVLSPNQVMYADLYFRLLLFPWEYMPSADDVLAFRNHITKHYDKSFATAFHHILTLQEKWMAEQRKKPSIFKKMTRKIRKLL